MKIATRLGGLVAAILVLSVVVAWAGPQKESPAAGSAQAAQPAGRYNEAPQLKDLVRAGKLPPVEQRISAEPLVVKPHKEIGKYGGVLKSPTSSAHTGGPDPRHIINQGWLARDQYTFKVVPNVAKSWDLSQDLKTLTLNLRKDMKWSDGQPFTSDDFMFWYQDILLNKDLTPSVPVQWKPGGEVMKAEAPDPYTIRLRFSVPYPAFVSFLADEDANVGMHHPKHYLTKWHTKYNPKADEVAKGEGFDAWWKAFNLHAAIFEAQQDPNLPSVNPWVMNKMTTEGDKIYGRNPYFWKVDTAGNQLPYIDEAQRVVVKTTEIMDLKTMSGELNVGGAKMSFRDYPVYKEGEQRGNYRAILMSGDVRTNQGMSFNLWHKDPVLRKIFNDIRFRQAMSLAMDRGKLNEVLYLGKAKPWQATTGAQCTFFEDWIGTYYTQYDPARANALLDEMGLKWDKDHKYRLRPDGQVLAINIQYVDLGSSWKERLEMKAKDWEAVGIKTAVKEIERSLYLTLEAAAELDFATWNYEAQESDLQYSKSYFLHGVYWNHPWSMWEQSGGKQGVEPPDDVKRYYQKMEQWSVSLPGSPEYIRLGKEVLGENVKMLWSLGDLVDGPQPAVFAKNLANTPDSGPLIWPGLRFWKLYRPDQWFFK